MTDLDLIGANSTLWRRCDTHSQAREDGICPACAADARPACTYCFGSGTVTHHSGGLEWPEPCGHCRGAWPHYPLDPPSKDEL